MFFKPVTKTLQNQPLQYSYQSDLKKSSIVLFFKPLTKTLQKQNSYHSGDVAGLVQMRHWTGAVRELIARYPR